MWLFNGTHRAYRTRLVPMLGTSRVLYAYVLKKIDHVIIYALLNGFYCVFCHQLYRDFLVKLLSLLAP